MADTKGFTFDKDIQFMKRFATKVFSSFLSSFLFCAVRLVIKIGHGGTLMSSVLAILYFAKGVQF